MLIEVGLCSLANQTVPPDSWVAASIRGLARWTVQSAVGPTEWMHAMLRKNMLWLVVWNLMEATGSLM